MIKGFSSLMIILFLISNISAICNETQIDINSASAEELDKLTGIGAVKAQAIIQARPFSSLDDLLNASGIGNATLNKIKQQGLACVSKEKNNSVFLEEDNSSLDIKNKKEIISAQNNLTFTTEEKSPENVNLTPIFLNAQDIKSENNNETLKRSLSFYGLIAISLIFGTLFLLKRRRKNEFN